MNCSMGKPGQCFISSRATSGQVRRLFCLVGELEGWFDLKILALSLNEGILTSRLRNAGIETYVVSEANNSL